MGQHRLVGYWLVLLPELRVGPRDATMWTMRTILQTLVLAGALFGLCVNALHPAGVSVLRPSALHAAGKSTSCTNVDLPDPDTPVTTTR